jgi:hypothetical protein
MKKSFLLLFVFVLALVLSACLQPISEVDSFTINGWTAKEYYDIDDVDGLWNDNVTLDVVYGDGAEESLDLGTGIEDQTVVITGDYAADPLGLKTDEKGYYSVTITVGDISLSFTYYVFDLTLARNVPSEYATIQAALSGAPENTVVFVADGTYDEALSVSGVTGLTIFGESREGVIIDSSGNTDRTFFASGAPGLSLINLTFTDDYSVGGGSGKRFMVKLQNETHDVVIRNVRIIGPGKTFQNSADGDEPVGGLDLNTINGAIIDNVHVSDISRNSMAFTSVTDLRVTDMRIERSGISEGWAAVALYGSTTLIEITGSIDDALLGINYTSTPYPDSFEFGNVLITNTFYPLFLFDSEDRGPEREFALNVTGMPWEVAARDINQDLGFLVYFATEADANTFVDFLQNGSTTIDEVTVPNSALFDSIELTDISDIS